jgi:CO/xanthine dehydrogenase FAD-binding subunit
LSDESADAVASMATDGVRPLNANQYKLPLMENLVRRAMRA